MKEETIKKLINAICNNPKINSHDIVYLIEDSKIDFSRAKVPARVWDEVLYTYEICKDETIRVMDFDPEYYGSLSVDYILDKLGI